MNSVFYIMFSNHHVFKPSSFQTIFCHGKLLNDQYNTYLVIGQYFYFINMLNNRLLKRNWTVTVSKEEMLIINNNLQQPSPGCICKLYELTVKLDAFIYLCLYLPTLNNYRAKNCSVITIIKFHKYFLWWLHAISLIHKNILISFNTSWWCRFT